ncbi:transcriptional regulator LldR [Stenotrophomonas sp. HITSZ_GD]|uniref:transcriptional regulator LldR n=1 Tax=Stenotrophomonas sp. HITSZ_GD TaxID=3037248 RepID=UPI00240D69F8|nr:transcriptional regulator LldR [Stenotrophomonas sp. HITSZ_GD]MDG2523995.1 transcriptional regulator LldR [Stenotrophomonas sp. HITSZ_GD]
MAISPPHPVGPIQESDRLSDRTATRLRRLIVERNLQPGQRLPAERVLALELGVSRSVVREAIQQLASLGMLATRAGGGTYVQAAAAPVHAVVEPLSHFREVLEADPEYRFDVLETRHALEAATAWHAALRATDEDRARIRDAFEAMGAAHAQEDAAAEALADARFHLAIAEASHNLVLVQVMRGLFALLQANISQTRQALYRDPRTAPALARQHRALCDAILAGDAPAAREAAEDHLAFVHEALRALDDNAARRDRASRLPLPVARRP